VIHYVENPGTTALFNQKFFESLKDGMRYGSTQWIVDDTYVLETMPPEEVAWHCGAANYTELADRHFSGYTGKDTSPNYCTEGIEFCHLDITGEPTPATRRNLVILAGMRVFANRLSERQVVRHYDVTRKQCPLYYVEHPREWENLVDDIMSEAIQLSERIRGT